MTHLLGSQVALRPARLPVLGLQGGASQRAQRSWEQRGGPGRRCWQSCVSWRREAGPGQPGPEPRRLLPAGVRGWRPAGLAVLAAGAAGAPRAPVWACWLRRRSDVVARRWRLSAPLLRLAFSSHRAGAGSRLPEEPHQTQVSPDGRARHRHARGTRHQQPITAAWRHQVPSSPGPGQEPRGHGTAGLPAPLRTPVLRLKVRPPQHLRKWPSWETGPWKRGLRVSEAVGVALVHQGCCPSRGTCHALVHLGGTPPSRGEARGRFPLPASEGPLWASDSGLRDRGRAQVGCLSRPPPPLRYSRPRTPEATWVPAGRGGGGREAVIGGSGVRGQWVVFEQRLWGLAQRSDTVAPLWSRGTHTGD